MAEVTRQRAGEAGAAAAGEAGAGTAGPADTGRGAGTGTGAGTGRDAAPGASPSGRGPRRSAEERREEIVAVAIEHFAISGYHAASTEAIAKDAGISQPYLFRLFGTKRQLFLACHEHSHRRILETFERAAAAAPEPERLQQMGHAYVDLLSDRTRLLFQMQSYAACSDPEIQARVRDSFGALVKRVGELSGAEPQDVWRFIANGMLLNVIASLDLPAIAGDEAWAAQWCDPGELIGPADEG